VQVPERVGLVVVVVGPVVVVVGATVVVVEDGSTVAMLWSSAIMSARVKSGLENWSSPSAPSI